MKKLALLFVCWLAACQTPPAAPPPPPPPPLAVSQLVTAILAEQKAFEEIWASAQAAGRELGALNGKLQAGGYFRRVPAQPAVEGMQAQLRQLAVVHLLTVQNMQIDLPPEASPVASVPLHPGERWQPKLDDLRGQLTITLDLQGSRQDAAKFIDDLPAQVDRLIVASKAEKRGDSVRMTLLAYFEKPLPQPQIVIAWPSLDERLRAAGLDPASPKVKADPAYADLAKQVEIGDHRIGDVRRILAITADFPRWLVRWQFFEERSKAVMATKGAQVLGI